MVINTDHLASPIVLLFNILYHGEHPKKCTLCASSHLSTALHCPDPYVSFVMLNAQLCCCFLLIFYFHIHFYLKREVNFAVTVFFFFHLFSFLKKNK